jgi:steroid delta-isomerase-like uncharacterized protein
VTRDQIEAMFARRYEALSRLDADALADDCSEDCIVESPLAGGAAVGRAAMTKVYAAFFRAFSNLTFHREAQVINLDRAAGLFQVSGTHTGEFMGMAPTGRSVNFPMAVFYDLRDGVIVRERRVYDFTGLLIQVGALRVKPS